MLFEHALRRAASRACWTAGKSRPTNTPMIAITTSNSINVKPDLALAKRPSELSFLRNIIRTLQTKNETMK